MRLYEIAPDEILSSVHSILLYLKPTTDTSSTVQIDSVVQMLQNQGVTVDRDALISMIQKDPMLGSLISRVKPNGVIDWKGPDDDDQKTQETPSDSEESGTEELSPEQRVDMMAQRAEAQTSMNQARLRRMATKAIKD